MLLALEVFVGAIYDPAGATAEKERKHHTLNNPVLTTRAHKERRQAGAEAEDHRLKDAIRPEGSCHPQNPSRNRVRPYQCGGHHKGRSCSTGGARQRKGKNVFQLHGDQRANDAQHWRRAGDIRYEN